jgi:hypothetical protein
MTFPMKEISGRSATRSIPSLVTAMTRLEDWLSGSPGRAAGIVAIVTFLVFLPAVRCGFVNWDDGHYVYDNPLVLAGLSPSGVLRAWTDVVFCNWAPLTVMSYQCDASLFGPRPWGFHLTNVFLHAAAAGWLCLALGRMTGVIGRSAAVAALFALHPLRVESVAWIAERKDVLSVALLMLALVAYEGYCRRPNGWRYCGVFAAVLASLLAKATGVTFPVLLLLLDVWPLGRLRWLATSSTGRYPPRSVSEVVGEKLPLFILSAGFIFFTMVTQSGTIRSGTEMPLLEARIPNAFQSIAFYLADTIVPLGLHPCHLHPGLHGWSWPLAGVGGVATLLIVGTAIRLWPTVPSWAVGWLWFFIAVSPVLGIVAQQGLQARGDRFTYLPHVGLFLAIVWGSETLLSRRQPWPAVRVALLLTVLSAWVAIDRLQIGHWANSEALWQHVLVLEPGHGVAANNLGMIRLAEGRPAEALRLFEQAARSLPQNQRIQRNIARATARLNPGAAVAPDANGDHDADPAAVSDDGNSPAVP